MNRTAYNRAYYEKNKERLRAEARHDAEQEIGSLPACTAAALFFVTLITRLRAVFSVSCALGALSSSFSRVRLPAGDAVTFGHLLRLVHFVLLRLGRHYAAVAAG